jgi:cytoskeleton protein RodZ
MASLRDIGQSLKEAREAQNVALEDIAARTRITVRHLMALEEGNEADLPEVFYVRGFLKKYAESVGLSPKDVADAYRAAPVPTTSQPSVSSSAGPIIYYVLIAALFAGLLYLAYYFQPKLSVVVEPTPGPGAHHASPHPKATGAVPGTAASGASAPTGEPSSAAVVPASGQASPALKPSLKPSLKPAAAASAPSDAALAATTPTASMQTPSPKPSLQPTDRITVELTIEQRSWVEVKVDGQPALEGLLSPKMHKSFKGRNVTVSAGNAGGVRITINGHDRGLLGERGVVVAKTYTPS